MSLVDKLLFSFLRMKHLNGVQELGGSPAYLNVQRTLPADVKLRHRIENPAAPRREYGFEDMSIIMQKEHFPLA